jgi:predicted alpha-1,2-mannosidase
LVNLLQGTDSHHGFSTGNTLPLAARPFGMNHWSLQTAEGSWFFSPQHRKLVGIRCTHQPSPWIGDYGALTVMAQSGERRLSAWSWASAYRLDRSLLSPAGFEIELIADGTRIAMSPTERASIFRFTFADSASGRVLVQPCLGEGEIQVGPDRRSFFGFTRGATGGVPEGYAMFFAGEFDRPMDTWLLFSPDSEPREADGREGVRVGLCAEWRRGGEPVLMRLATSFISVDQARLNLDREVGNAGLEEVRDDGEAIWEDRLGRIVPEGGTEAQQRTFTSCLYRTQLFPRIWHEPDATGALWHRSPYDGQVHAGVLYSDNGFWDTYRTEYPLLALIDPVRTAEILQGWVNAFQEGGWFPQWASPGYRACMVGTHIDAVIADGVSRGVTDFDLEGAYRGMLKHAFEVGAADGAYGRIGIEDYLRLGYVSLTHHESVARSLDYAYDDWCIAQVGRFLGKDVSAIESRTGNYRHLWDASSGFMRARNADGSWQTPFSEFRWGNPYVEGGAWQSLWAVPHDVPGLIELLGGKDAFLQKLDAMMSMPPRFEIGDYGAEIHEMTEMAMADFGQYAHSNQPVHHVLYLYTAAGRPDLTAHYVHRVLNELYSPTSLPGDEDNGEMCAWYVLSAMGLFPSCPGDGHWTTVTPLFPSVSVRLANGRELLVRRDDSGHRGATVSHASVVSGGSLLIA